MSGLANKRILYVEDDEADVLLTERAFAHFQFDAKLETAPDGQAALDMLKTGPPPDLVITDIKMPRMNGLEFQERLRGDGRLSRIPLIMLTSSAEKGDRERALSHGALAFLQKPMGLDAWKPIVDTLRKLLGG